MGPPLREDGDSIDVGLQQFLKGAHHAIQTPTVLRRDRPPGQLIHRVHRADPRMELEEVGELTAKLACAKDTDRKRHCLPFLGAPWAAAALCCVRTSLAA
ncbi:hypothetical protein GCM10010523_02000 [Paenarthrobacter ilicis]